MNKQQAQAKVKDLTAKKAVAFKGGDFDAYVQSGIDLDNAKRELRRASR